MAAEGGADEDEDADVGGGDVCDGVAAICFFDATAAASAVGADADFTAAAVVGTAGRAGAESTAVAAFVVFCGAGKGWLF